MSKRLMLPVSNCPSCERTRFKTLKSEQSWEKVKNKKALPDNLPEETCPSCLLDIAIESNVLSQRQPS